MAEPTVTVGVLKQAVKEAVVEALHEQQEWLRDIFLEVMEEAALAEAIREGEATEEVSREDIFRLLDGAE
jgi:hypothetical protein